MKLGTGRKPWPRQHPTLDGLTKTEKRCRDCGETKPLNAFVKNNRAPDGYAYWCKACKQRKQRAEYDYDTGRNRWLKSKYGLSQAEYDRMFEEQGGRCAICRNEEWCNPSGPVLTRDGKRRSSQRVLHVDHDHDTNQVRALLCNRCNRGIGAFEDDPDRLLVARDYLLEWKKQLA